jgi:hypothetical protein
MDKKISQSILKDFNSYKGKELCGLQFKGKYYDDLQFPSTEAMNLGNYFEYLCTGALPKNGNIPEPKISYKGTKRETLATPYLRAKESASLFKKICKELNIEIEKVGLKLESKYKQGTLDIWGKVDGKPAIIDLKYSGLIDDKWSETGWEDESLHYKEKLLVQAVHYKLLISENYNLDLKDFDFYFLVFSSKEVHNVKFFRINIDDDMFSFHNAHIESLYKHLNALDIEKDFVPYPSLKSCFKCPLFESCEHKTEVPIVKEIYYGS